MSEAAELGPSHCPTCRAEGQADEGIVIWPGHRTYHTVEVGLLRSAIARAPTPPHRDTE